MTNTLHERIIEELAAHRVCHVATVEGDRPLNSTLEYVADGTTLFLASIPDTQKVRNLKRNPQVAITMSGPGGPPERIRGIQYFGVARRISDPAEVEATRTRFFDRFLLDPAAHGVRKRNVYYEITPERIDLIDYAPGFGHKETFTP